MDGVASDAHRPADGFALFDTAIGRCGIAWSARGLVTLHLPEADDDTMRERLARRHAPARERTPPPSMQRAIDGIVRLLAGGADDLRDVPIDDATIPPFDRRVYDLARGIGPGQTSTYGEVAARLGDAGLARAVGQALGRNPFAVVVPCHRVTAAGGALGGFSAPGGADTKRRLLHIESVHRRGALL